MWVSGWGIHVCVLIIHRGQRPTDRCCVYVCVRHVQSGLEHKISSQKIREMLVYLVHRLNSVSTFLINLDVFVNTSLESDRVASNDNEWDVRKHVDENCRGTIMSQNSPGHILAKMAGILPCVTKQNWRHLHANVARMLKETVPTRYLLFKYSYYSD